MLNLAILLSVLVAGSIGGNRLKTFCYFTNWSDNIAAVDARFQLEDIDPSLCTHLIYAFANINTDTLRLNPSAKGDDNGKIGAERDGRYFQFTGLKEENPGLVTILSVGGARAGSKGFIQIVQVEENMVEFSNNVAIFLRDRDFDGVDIDWEYPSSYKDKFTQLLKTMRQTFEDEAANSGKPRLLLTIAAGVGSDTIDSSYNITEISKYVDYIHLMTYDFHGPWSKVTSFTSPLYSRASDPTFSQELSQDWAVRRWLAGGAPVDKLVLGLTATVNTFILNSTQTGVGAPVAGPGPKGRYLEQAGHCPYYHLCQVLKRQGVVQNWDEEQKMAYAYQDDNWYGYNNARSIRAKVQYATSMNFAGVMFWSLDLDDFMDVCGQGKYPLLSAMHDEVVKTATTPGTTATPTESTEIHPRTNKNGINFYNVNDGSGMVIAVLGNTVVAVLLSLLFIL